MTHTAKAITPAFTGRRCLDAMILVRLLAAGKPPTRSDLDRALKRYYVDRLDLTSTQWLSLLDSALERLQSENLLRTRPYRLTDAGRAAVQEFLGVDSLPSNVKWQTLRNRYLVTTALGLRPKSKTEWERIGTSDGLRASLLIQHFDLQIPPYSTPARALHALAWKQLGEERAVTPPLGMDFTRNNVLSATLLAGRKSTRPAEPLAAQAVGAASSHPDKLREAVLKRWLDKHEKRGAELEVEDAPPARETDRPELDLHAFATRVLEIARSATSGRFGDNKVFIADVWDRFQSDASGISREEFDDHLVEANRRDLLTLSRADLIGAMDLDDVQRSEIQRPRASFHFVRTDR